MCHPPGGAKPGRWPIRRRGALVPRGEGGSAHNPGLTAAAGGSAGEGAHAQAGQSECCWGCRAAADRCLFHYGKGYINPQNGEEEAQREYLHFSFPISSPQSLPPSPKHNLFQSLPHLVQSDFNHHFRQNTLSWCVRSRWGGWGSGWGV